MVTELEKAWFAGLFDGEGYVQLLRTRCNRFALTIGINMTDLAAIKKCRTIWGMGSINLLHKANVGKDGYRRKALWRWCAKSNQALKILQSIQPLLITKQAQACKAITFQLYKRDDNKVAIESLIVSHLKEIKAGVYDRYINAEISV